MLDLTHRSPPRTGTPGEQNIVPYPRPDSRRYELRIPYRSVTGQLTRYGGVRYRRGACPHAPDDDLPEHPCPACWPAGQPYPLIFRPVLPALLHDRRPRRAVHRLPRDRVPDPPASPSCKHPESYSSQKCRRPPLGGPQHNHISRSFRPAARRPKQPRVTNRRSTSVATITGQLDRRQSQVTSPSRYLALREHRTRTADPGLRPITVTWP